MDKNTQKYLKGLVEKNYQDIAHEFNLTRKKALWPELIKLAQEVRPEESVLDAGCGNGRLLEALPSEANYIGVDASKTLIGLAQENYPSKTFRVLDLLELGNLEKFNFQHVFCIAVLHHLPGTEARLACLRQLKNKIATDGRLVVSVWNLRANPEHRRLIRRFALLKLIGKNRMDWGDILFDWKDTTGQAVSKRYYHAFKLKELTKLCTKAGLKVKEVHESDHNFYLILSK